MTKRFVLAGAGSITALMLTACANFFVNPTTTTPVTSSTGDYAYVVNANNTVSEYVVSAGALTAVSGSPLALASGLGASSITVARSNNFAYVGGDGAIECYSVGTDGSLTQVSTGGVSETANFISLDTSPDGNWLFGLDAIQPTAPALYVFAINQTTGVLTLAGSAGVALPVPGSGTSAPKMVRISPNGLLVGVALGAGGDVFYNFATATGILTKVGSLATNGFEDDAILFDSTSAYAYIGRYGLTAGAGSIASYTVATSGILTSLSSVTTGDAPYSLVLDGTGGYVYSANRGGPTVSAFSLEKGVLTQLASSPYPSGTAVTALARDNSGDEVLAVAAGGSSDITLYTIDALTAGKLDAVAAITNGSGTAGSLAVATTHSTTEDY